MLSERHPEWSETFTGRNERFAGTRERLIPPGLLRLAELIKQGPVGPGLREDMGGGRSGFQPLRHAARCRVYVCTFGERLSDTLHLPRLSAFMCPENKPPLRASVSAPRRFCVEEGEMQKRKVAKTLSRFSWSQGEREVHGRLRFLSSGLSHALRDRHRGPVSCVLCAVFCVRALPPGICC